MKGALAANVCLRFLRAGAAAAAAALTSSFRRSGVAQLGPSRFFFFCDAHLLRNVLYV